jgi:hypothetical protein
MASTLKVECGSGNVFRDLGFSKAGTAKRVDRATMRRRIRARTRGA